MENEIVGVVMGVYSNYSLLSFLATKVRLRGIYARPFDCAIIVRTFYAKGAYFLIK